MAEDAQAQKVLSKWKTQLHQRPSSPTSPKTPHDTHSWSVSTAQFCRRKPSARCTGLALPAFDDDFDLFFEVKSDFLGSALEGVPTRKDAQPRCQRIPEFKKNPIYWGMKIDTLSLFWEYVQADALGYAAAHYVDEKFRNICLSTPCEWHHHDRKMVIAESAAVGQTRPMTVNMHLINSRYIKPWTQQFEASAGLALVLNTARLCDRPGPAAEDICKASIFISHCWDELSIAFFGTLTRDFDPDRIVWICSFALDQNGHVSDELKHVETTPFYQALKAADSVTAITDASIEVFDRVWCVLEAHLALALEKPFNMLLWEDENHEVWHQAAGKLAHIDVHNCNATVQADKDLILAYCDQHLDEVNKHLHQISGGAVFQAELRSFAKEGNLPELYARLSLDQLRQWKTGKRHRTLTHLFAVYHHVPEMLEFSEKINHEQLDEIDIDCRTPLSLACEVGEVATVNALVTLRAGVDSASARGLSPLHYAAECGHRAVVHILKNAGANIQALGTFKGEKDHSPMSVAVVRDAPGIVRDFLDWRCDGNFEVEGWPVIHLAAQWGHTRIVAALLASEVNVNARSSEGRTPLMHAATNGHASVVAVLRSVNADPTLVDNEGHTVQDCIEECRHDHPLEADDIQWYLKNARVDRFIPVDATASLNAPKPNADPMPLRSSLYAQDPFAEGPAKAADAKVQEFPMPTLSKAPAHPTASMMSISPTASMMSMSATPSITTCMSASPTASMSFPSSARNFASANSMAARVVQVANVSHSSRRSSASQSMPTNSGQPMVHRALSMGSSGGSIGVPGGGMQFKVPSRRVSMIDPTRAVLPDGMKSHIVALPPPSLPQELTASRKI